ncbi:MAG: phage regulatory protein/antirepressor Ant, partial [Lachnoclostridium sp.]|nr:phage regulatory protein/antirepressor Ant [Lachnoclostridium sp.]
FTGNKALQFKMDFIRAFNQMEALLNSDEYILQRSYKILEGKVQSLENENQQKAIALQKAQSAIVFTEKVQGSKTLILVRDLAKLLNQNGIDIGEIRLYNWLVENKYLICNKRWSNTKQKYINDYQPTQRAADLKVFFVSETTINHEETNFIKHSVKVTGKGQVHFIDKFLKNNNVDT